MGRAFTWLWVAFTASTVGTWLSFGAFPLIAIRVLDAGPTAVSLLAASGPAAGALLALRLGPWVERHDKRAVTMLADVVRGTALLSVPVAHHLGRLTFVQLMVVSVIGAAANIAFTAASGAYLKQIVGPDRLLRANARFESTAWTAIAIGPTLGGAAVTLLGPVVTVYANAAGFLLSGLALAAIRDRSPYQRRVVIGPARLTDGWRFLNGDARLRALFRNTIAVNALIMATEPLLAVLLLGELGWPAWQYGLAFGLPCLGGLLGAQLAVRLEPRYGRARALSAAGVLRVLSPVALIAVTPGIPGLLLVVAVELVVITGMGVFYPLLATERLQRLPDDRISRVLTFWTVANTGTIAAVTALWGVLAAVVGARAAIGAAGILLLFTPLLGHLPDAGDSPGGTGAVRRRWLAWGR